MYTGVSAVQRGIRGKLCSVSCVHAHIHHVRYRILFFVPLEYIMQALKSLDAKLIIPTGEKCCYEISLMSNLLNLHLAYYKILNIYAMIGYTNTIKFQKFKFANISIHVLVYDYYAQHR